jgi:hypothetical protein
MEGCGMLSSMNPNTVIAKKIAITSVSPERIIVVTGSDRL